MTSTEMGNIEVIQKYYGGCNSGNVEELLATLAPEVTHYFLPYSFPPNQWGGALGKVLLKVQAGPQPRLGNRSHHCEGH
jgi:ketosteroid isomerase-like protein